MEKKLFLFLSTDELNQDLSCPPRVCRPAGGSVRAARLAPVDWVVVRGEDRGRTSLGIPAQPSPAQPSSPHLEAGWVHWHTANQQQPCTPPVLCPAAQYSGAGHPHRSGRSCDGSQLRRSGPITPAGLGWAGLGWAGRGGESEISLWKIFNNKVLGKAGLGGLGWWAGQGWVKMCYQNLVS